MSGGFSNPIVGGGGSLVYPSIHSPNYVTEVSGWTINKDGSAEFSNLTIRGTFNGTDFIINANGVFFYNAAPALGTLFLAMTSGHAVSDPSGNVVPNPGLTVGKWSALGVLGQTFLVDPLGHLFTQDPTTNAYFLAGFPEFGAIGSFAANVVPVAIMSAIAGNDSYYGSGDSWGAGYTGPVAAWKPGSQAAAAAVPESWHLMGPGLAAGFAVGNFIAPRYRLEPIGAGVVRLSGAITLTANQAANTTFFTLPAGYRPAGQPFLKCQSNLSGLSLGAAPIQVTTGGAIQLNVAGVNGNFVTMDGVTFELD